MNVESDPRLQGLSGNAYIELRDQIEVEDHQGTSPGADELTESTEPQKDRPPGGSTASLAGPQGGAVSTAVQRVLDALSAHDCGCRPSGNDWSACCPSSSAR